MSSVEVGGLFRHLERGPLDFVGGLVVMQGEELAGGCGYGCCVGHGVGCERVKRRS